MSQPPDSLLIRMVANAAALDAEVRSHVERCAACRARVDSFRQVHALLGEWAVQPGSRDVTSAVLRGIETAPPAPQRSLVVWRNVGRYAAAILIGVGAGYAGSGALRTNGQAGTHAEADSGAATAEPTIELFTRPASTGLWLTIGELDAQAAAEEGGT